jgi:hypothetical protein
VSETQQSGANGAAPHAAIEGLTAEEVEASARALGWKPQAEFRGPPDKWRPADQFMASAANPAILANNFRVLSDRYRTLESTHRTTTQQLTQKLDEAVSMVGTLTERTRTSEERAYARARKELLAERDKAITEGDAPRVRELDTEVQELDAGKPPPKPTATTATTTTTAAPAQPTTQQLDPEIAAWSTRNPWFFSDPDLAAAANGVSSALRANPATASLSVADHLVQVENTIKRTFPDKFAAPKSAARAVAAGDEDDDAEPPAVETPNSGGAGRPQGQRNRRDFASMPRESKQQFARYKEMIGRKVEEGGRVKPLTEAEWAANYWSQFEDA